ncbi:class F sortase [Modestobacter sp. URMC 112]
MRPAAAGVVFGLALAVGVPTVWELAQPPASAGAPVEQALAATPVPPAATTTPAPPSSGVPTADAVPAVPTRDATPAPPAVVPPPVRLAVPALGVDTAVDPVGVGDDGSMALPDDVDRVGWYRFGPVPGAGGSAVLAGHVDGWDQGLGALAPLRGAEVDDEVLVTDGAGTVTRWRVVGREVLEKRALPLDTLFARTGDPRLVLVTCGGPYLPELRSYRDNVVVVAVPA